MNALNNLINKRVIATIEGDDKTYDIIGTVLNVDVNDYYFYEKGESIFITVTINPENELPEEIDIEELQNIPLENIRKA